MSTDMSLQDFVKNISNASTGGKELFHYKCTPTMISMYNSMVAYKNVTKREAVVIPSAKVDTNHRISFEFCGADVSDLGQLVSCIKKNSTKPPQIRENVKTITVKI
jgi:hypothetical protein